MYVVCVTVHVTDGSADDFFAAIMDNASQTRKEQGNVRFDVLRAEDDPNRFFLYEAYRGKEDFAAHQQTPHYLRWREAVAGMMAEPRQGVKYVSLFPEEEAW